MKVLLLALLALAALTGCSAAGIDIGPPKPPPVVSPGALRSLEVNRDIWKSQNIRDYRFTFDRRCECDGGLFELTVEDGKVVDARRLLGEELPPERFSSIEEMFEIIETTIQSGIGVSALYDTELGYPVEVVLDTDAIEYDGGEVWTIGELEPTDGGESSAAEAALEAGAAAWGRAGLTAYRYTFGRVCLCPREHLGPFDVAVAGGTVAQVERDGEPVEPTSQDFYTVDELFELIELAIVEGVGSVIVDYDSELGYPREIAIDWDLMVADEETILTVDRLIPTG